MERESVRGGRVGFAEYLVEKVLDAGEPQKLEEAMVRRRALRVEGELGAPVRLSPG